jgi:hypothetical protein
MTFDELEKINRLAEEYLATIDDTIKDEWWATERAVQEHGVELFLDWLGQKIGEEI